MILGYVLWPSRPPSRSQSPPPPPPSPPYSYPSSFLPPPVASVKPHMTRCARPKRPFLAMVVACATVCWLMLVQSLSPFPRGIFDPAAAHYPAFPPPPDGPPPRSDQWRGLSKEEVDNLSVLGRYLFLNDTTNIHPQKKKFTILIWKYGKWLERRHIKRFGEKAFDPFEDCSVSNCVITIDDKDFDSADAVVFHLHQTQNADVLPVRNKTHENQRWIFLTDESPMNTFVHRHQNTLYKHNGIFNWTMNYRLDADVPVPYGRTVPLTASEAAAAAAVPGGVARNYALGKTGMAAILSSNCGSNNDRWNLIRSLQKLMPVDIYGRCGPLKCPGHFKQDCPALRKYKFYLAFENSNCKDYATEKLWWNAYKNEAVPVILGVSRENCNKLIPRRSYIHSADFASPADLARFILHLNQSDRDYNAYFQWKYQYKILNEHGYFQSPSYHYCRVCEALNYNDPAPKEYNDLEKVWNSRDDCYYRSHDMV